MQATWAPLPWNAGCLQVRLLDRWAHTHTTHTLTHTLTHSHTHAHTHTHTRARTHTRLSLISHLFREVTPYSSTFRRMWSGRGGHALNAPLAKLRQAHDTLRKRRPSSEVSVTRSTQLSRQLSFQGPGRQQGITLTPHPHSHLSH